MTNRMQVDRRKDTIPWTWEPFAAALIIYIFVALVAAQVARGIAYLFAGHGFRWPTAQTQVSSAVQVLAGHSAAGLPGSAGPDVPGSLLYACLITVEVIALIVLTWAAVAASLRWGPARMLGMATRTEAQKLLGRARLHRQAKVIRPDLRRPLTSPEPVRVAADLSSTSADGIQDTRRHSLRTRRRDLAARLLGDGSRRV